MSISQILWGKICITFFEMTIWAIQAIFGLILILFIPGYAVSYVLYPQKNEMPVIQRLGLSMILSIILVVLIALFIDEGLAFNTTPQNLVAAILIFSIIAALLWKIECIWQKKVFPLFMGNLILEDKIFSFVKILKNSGSISVLLSAAKSKLKNEEQDDAL